MTVQRGRYISLALVLSLLLGACSQAPKAQQTSGPSPTQTATSAPSTSSPTPSATSTPAPAAATVTATPEPAATEAPATTAAPGAAAPATTQAPARTQTPATQAPVATQAPAPAPTAAPTAPPPPPTATPVPAPTIAPPPPTAQPSGGGFVFPTFFVSILESRNGRLGVLTSGGAACSAVARLPDNVTILQLGTKTVGSSGMVNFDYAPTTQSGVGVHRVDCSFNGQREFAEARFNAP